MYEVMCWLNLRISVSGIYFCTHALTSSVYIVMFRAGKLANHKMHTLFNNLAFSGTVRKYHNLKPQNVDLWHKLCQTCGLGLLSVRVCTSSILQNSKYPVFN